MSICVLVKRGPDIGKKFTIEKNDFIIGRDRSADVSINDLTVSRHHCHIFLDNGVLKIEDLQSRNRTVVNNSSIDNIGVIGENDDVVIGETVLHIFKIRQIQSKENPDKQLVVEEEPLYKPQTVILPTQEFSIDKIANNLELIYKVTAAIHSIRSRKQLMKTLLELIMDVIPADNGVIFSANEKQNTLSNEIIISAQPEFHQADVSHAIAYYVFNQRVGILANDAMADPRFKNIPPVQYNTIRSVLTVPIGTIGAMFGVIHLESRNHPGVFCEKDLHLLSAIANQAAIAIENIQFFDSLNEENKILQEALQKDFNMVGRSQEMQKIFGLINKLAITDSTILIRGESGTGKELVARGIHYTSSRRNKPFVFVNCAALNKNLLESEIFGHEKGAFTGADSQKKGRFELAHGGTIFLDEIGELNPESQAKLLRILEEGVFERVGGTENIQVNVRILAATNRDLEEAIQEKIFREDLFYRLNVIQIDMPPLRQRRDDILPLALFFLEKFRKEIGRESLQISQEAIDLLKNYHWPGNVRELKNYIERAVVLCSHPTIQPEDLPINPHAIYLKDNEPFPTLQEIECSHVIAALKFTGWNKKHAAELLGIQRSTLYEKLKMYNIAN
ncbi:sigma 54-interacting transcriptional regulator [bacterium]|nr:sigma 54-interacting transcriptional regulator [bacterium]